MPGAGARPVRTGASSAGHTRWLGSAGEDRLPEHRRRVRRVCSRARVCAPGSRRSATCGSQTTCPTSTSSCGGSRSPTCCCSRRTCPTRRCARPSGRLRLVAFTGTGAASYVSVPLAHELGIAVTNVTHYGDQAVAELDPGPDVRRGPRRAGRGRRRASGPVGRPARTRARGRDSRRGRVRWDRARRRTDGPCDRDAGPGALAPARPGCARGGGAQRRSGWTRRSRGPTW